MAEHEHSRLIDDLGGGSKIAAALNKRLNLDRPLDRENVYKWKINGVPWKYRTAVAQLADERSVALPADFITVAA